MSDPLTGLLTIALSAIAVVLLGVAILRLRREVILTTRSLIIRGVMPLAATAGYLIVGGPPYSPTLVGVASAIGLGLGTLTAGLVRMGRVGDSVFIRQTGATLALWSIAYLAASSAALVPRADLQALTALALSAGAGLVVGEQLGLFVRARSAGPLALRPEGAARRAPDDAHLTHGGSRFLLGYTASENAIWDRAAMQAPVAQYPRTSEGRAGAWRQFTMWEPQATPIAPYPGIRLASVADAPVAFTHVGSRFAIGRTSTAYAIWDRWSPGAPVATFASDSEGAAHAWQTFSAWEPAAMAL
ncbi:MAG: hypothetical protein QFC55_00355 [Chloroflexota bacterium]|nr:hypothetical protein [Chloroflexota bacterium]